MLRIPLLAFKPWLVRGCFAFLFLWAATSVRADGIVNGDFQTGDLTGWTPFVTTNGTLGSGYPQVTQFDIEMNGSPSDAATFQVGKVDSSTGTGGGGIYQDFSLSSSTSITFSLDVGSTLSSSNVSPNGDGGTFSLLLDGTTLATYVVGPLNPGGQVYDLLTATVPVSAGQHQLEISITRQFTSTSTAPTEYIDNVQLNVATVPEPGEAALLGLGVIALAARFRRPAHRLRPVARMGAAKSPRLCRATIAKALRHYGD